MRLLSIFALCFFLTSTAQAQLSSICPNVVDISSRGAGSLVQWKNNQVQRSGGVGSSLTGFLGAPTIIATQGRNPFTNTRAIIYDRNGRSVCTSSTRQGCASTRGECLARYKFPCATTRVRQATSGGAFVKVSGNTCIRVPSAGRCYNVKVRGLCDGRTL